MSELEAVSRLVELGMSGILLAFVLRVYADKQAAVQRHINYIEKKYDESLERDRERTQPYRTPYQYGYLSNAPTQLGEPQPPARPPSNSGD